MFSYQHEYHAGNHADVLKHICLTLILDGLTKKDKPFTLIDSHAGAGRFSLDDERLLKTGEATGGILSLVQYAEKNGFPSSVARYLEVEKKYLEKGLYAGSPELERFFLRNGDSLHLIEKHPQALSSLKVNAEKNLLTDGGEKKCGGKCFIHDEDSYTALNALVPPQIKRGLVLCDPSFEERSDYTKVTAALKNVRKKWNTAVIALWYPILERKKNETAQMLAELEDFGKLGVNPCESIKCEFHLFDSENIPEEMKKEDGSHMTGSGMFIMNPPWQLKEKMEEAIHYLETALKNK
ncbi:MAG: 23S rRNA (adenine(2030)-N(6))-methyltransferase RlmJ [Treponema sp.]|nr:23S rRNA (adenine(2030)-N(6))-methyltransferase RlmJ [Treponema sp.]